MKDDAITNNETRPAAATFGLYEDFANAIVEAHNNEGREITAESLGRATVHCDIEQRYAIALELPAWAQQKLNAEVAE